jgi:tetratricopeptide (TPR) repeat protein
MGHDATAIDLLNAASVKLDEGVFMGQPHTELLVRYRLGNLIKELGYSKKAIPYLERVQEIYEKYGAPKPLSSHLIMNYLGLAYLRSGEREKAEALFRQIVEEKEETNNIYTDLYPWAKQRLAEIYRMKAQYTESESILLGMMKPQNRKGEGLPPIYMVRCMRDLASGYRGQGRYEEAEQMYIKVQEMDKEVPSILLANLYSDMGRYRQAEELLRAAIERIPDQVPGKDPMQLMRAKNDLAVVLTKQGDFEEAERLFTEVLKVRKERWSDDHPDTLTTINAFGVLRREQKKYEQAESLLRQALDGRLRKLGKDYPDCLESMHELAILYKEQARYEEAEKYFIEALNGRRLKLGDTHPHTLESWKNLIDLYEVWGKPEKAEEWRAKQPQTEVANK